MSLLSWGMTELYCRYGLRLTRYREIITSLDLLAMLLLGVRCWLMSSLLCTRTPWAYSTELLPMWSVHSLHYYVGLFQMQDFILIFVNLVRFLLAHL